MPGPLVATTLAAGIVDGAVHAGSASITTTSRADSSGLIEYAVPDVADAVVIHDADGLWQVEVETYCRRRPSRARSNPLTPVGRIVPHCPKGTRIGGAE